MSNNLGQIEKLVLKGSFERSEKTKQKEKEELESLGQITAKMKALLAFTNQNFPFEVKILDFDLDSGIFIARGDDVFGESVIHGTIKHGEMDFKKLYVGDPKHDFPVQRINPVHYFGWMGISGEGIRCIGTYETHPGSSENGEWELSSFNKPRVWTL